MQYSVTAESQATPNVDFTPVTGTLTWEPFDMSPKTIAVPILDDAAVESEETVRIQLSTTSPGVTAHTSVIGTIVDDEGSSGSSYQMVSVVSESAPVGKPSAVAITHGGMSGTSGPHNQRSRSSRSMP